MKIRKNLRLFSIALLLICLLTFVFSCQSNQQEQNKTISVELLDIRHDEVKRVGMVIKIRPENLESYKALHADTVNGVRDLLTKYNLRNFSIFLIQLEDSNNYEFGYYEYWGNNFEEDMENLNNEPRNKGWPSSIIVAISFRRKPIPGKVKEQCAG